VLHSESAFYNTRPAAFSIYKSTYKGAAMSGLGHPRRYAKHGFSNKNKAIRDQNPYLLLCMKCDVAEIRIYINITPQLISIYELDQSPKLPVHKDTREVS
jgi:hypothetical protein